MRNKFVGAGRPATSRDPAAVNWPLHAFICSHTNLETEC